MIRRVNWKLIGPLIAGTVLVGGAGEQAIVQAQQAHHSMRDRSHRDQGANGHVAGAEIGPGGTASQPVGEQAPGAATTGRWRTPARPVRGKAGEPGRGPTAAPPPRPGRRSPPGSSPFGSSACGQQRAGNDQGQRAGHDAGDIELHSSTHERHRESAHPRRRRHSPHRSYRPRATADVPAEGRTVISVAPSGRGRTD